MLKPPMHPLEMARADTIDALELGSSSVEDIYEAVVGLLSDAMEVPICLLSVVQGDRQFFKSNIGLPVRETPRDISFCGHAIVQDEDIMVVEDTALDSRFDDNPLVLGEPKIRFYAGAVINAPNNLPIGTVCAIDTHARTLSERDRQHLMRAKLLMESAISLRTMSIRDHLTGLYNRRYFDHYFAAEWRRAYRHMMPLTVLLFDVDNFKTFNDRLGHAAFGFLDPGHRAHETGAKLANFARRAKRVGQHHPALGAGLIGADSRLEQSQRPHQQSIGLCPCQHRRCQQHDQRHHDQQPLRPHDARDVAF